MEETDWESYGTGRDERCADCMMHCGYEASAVDETFSSLRGFLTTVRASVFGNRSGKVGRDAPGSGFPLAPEPLATPREALVGSTPSKFTKELPVLSAGQK
jgi:hypothetical protein